jgi:tail protein
VAITLGSVTFDDAHTTVREKQEEVGGRNERRIELAGVIVGESTIAAVEAQLDAIIDAASVDDFSAALSLRDGRRLWVRRDAFNREIQRDRLVGAFQLTLLARDPFEEAVSETFVNWTITASGATKAASAAGNVFAKPVITLTANDTLINPGFSDGTRSIAYSGSVAASSVLVFDAAQGMVTLDGADVTPYTTGVFPRISPEDTTLTYSDDPSSSHDVDATVAFRDRWW